MGRGNRRALPACAVAAIRNGCPPAVPDPSAPAVGSRAQKRECAARSASRSAFPSAVGVELGFT